jgi:hypothetical protein
MQRVDWPPGPLSVKQSLALHTGTNFKEGKHLLKTRKKWISVLITLAMLVGLMVPFAGSAMAATTNTALTVPVVQSTASNVYLGTLRLTETESSRGSIDVGQQITITLPSGVEYAVPAAPAPGGDELPAYAEGGNGVKVKVVHATSKSLTVEVTHKAEEGKNGIIEFPFNNASAVNLSNAPAEIAIDIFAPGTGVTSGSVVVATTAGAGTKATVLSSSTVGLGSAKKIGTLRIAETRSQSIAANTYIKLTLPAGLTWETAHATKKCSATSVNWGTINIGSATNDDGFSELRLETAQAAPAGSIGFLTADLYVNVNDRNFSGPINVKVSGTNVTTETVEIGKVGSYAVNVTTEAELPEVKAGAVKQAIAKVYLEESLANSFIKGRYFDIILPDYAHWYTNPTFSRDFGDVSLALSPNSTIQTLDDNRTKISVDVTGDANTARTKYTLKDAYIYLDANAPEGDLVLTFKGNSFEEASIAVAKVVDPVKGETTVEDVIIGRMDQPAGNITITETKAGNLKANVLTIGDGTADKTPDKDTLGNNASAPAELWLIPPAGVSFASTPTVTVTEGDLKLKDKNIKRSGGMLIIPIDKASTVASTIEISDVYLTVDRTVPEGDIEIKVAGNAVDQVYPFTDGVVIAVPATTVTPAPADTWRDVAFTIGSTSYVVNGVEYTMDAAPYISNNRTFMPMRYAANALGISAENILWDGKTATFIDNNRVVQVTPGSTTMLVNGAPITLDAAAQNVNGRVMVPFRWVAQAFGASVDYDEATKTVTMERYIPGAN